MCVTVCVCVCVCGWVGWVAGCVRVRVRVRVCVLWDSVTGNDSGKCVLDALSGVAKGGNMGACPPPSQPEISICLRLLWASPPDPHQGSAPGPRWETSVPYTSYFAPSHSKFLATPLYAL